MSQSLTQNRDSLGCHRGKIVRAALTSSIAGSVPIPILDEWISSAVRQTLIRHIADGHDVDLDDSAARVIADGPTQPRSLSDVVSAMVAMRFLARQWRRFVLAVVITRRTKAAQKTFLIGTLFDHYCTRLHLGLGLTHQTGTRLRAVIDDAIATTPGSLGGMALSRGVHRISRGTTALPRKALDTLKRLGPERRLGTADEIQVASEVNQALEDQLRGNRGRMARTLAQLELQFTPEHNPYLETLISTFERLWKERHGTNR